LDKFNVDSTGGSGSASIDGDITSLALMLNGYFDIRSFSTIVPYLTAGIGYANLELSPISIAVPGYGTFATVASYDDNVFAYQVGIGVAYDINETITADFK